MRRLVVVALAALAAAGGCKPDSNGFTWPKPGIGKGLSKRDGNGDQERGLSILLCVLRDPAGHVRDAKEYRKLLEADPGWKGLSVVHKTGHSELYWGRYATVDAAQSNLAKAKAFRTPAGVPLFAQAIVVPLQLDDIGPAEWNLKNAKGGAYSLLVAVFKDDPERKYTGRRRRAVELCEKLRQKEYEAYYHHGPAVSDVTIGTFKRGSVRVKWTPTGAQLDILDQHIEALQQQFPYLVLNGNTISFVTRDPRTRRIIGRETRRTYLIRIPGSGEIEEDLLQRAH